MIDILIVITIFSYMEHHSWKSGINIKLYKSYINTVLSFKHFWVVVVSIFATPFSVTMYLYHYHPTIHQGYSKHEPWKLEPKPL